MRVLYVSFISILSFPPACGRQVETGIQDMKNWIPAFAGMTSPVWEPPLP